MSLDPPTYLFALQNNIRARPIPWEGAVRAGQITEGHLKKIKAVDKVRKEQRKQIIESDLDGYKALLLGDGSNQNVLESAAKRVDVLQYILVLVRDLIDDIPSLTPSLLSHPDPYKPFLPLLSQSSNPEDPLPLLTSSVLAVLVSSALSTSSKSTPETEKALPKLYTYLSTLAKSSDSGLQDIAVQEYSELLRSKKSRELFWRQREETLSPLLEILTAAAHLGKSSDNGSTLWSGASSIRSATDVGIGGGVGLQLLYHVLLVIWQLSFEGELVGRGLEEEYEIIPLYTQLMRLSPKEKTTRLLISTTHNLIASNPTSLLPAATLARLPGTLANLQGRHLTDPDLLEDLQSLTTMLDEHMKTQTTFDEYAAEVRSGHLCWSPPHRNATFWRENGRRILLSEQEELPKKLVEILAKRWESDKKVLAVACNDVGWLVKEVPEKRATLEKMGVKARVMELMADADESVRWEALRATGEWLRYHFDD
ncbi:MAG: H(+)-transporting V1 sector ATPase subunit H [Sclerophora amabilis]|nr:MAG: H(+)-transporting V1 sector ATPase subunit H [Sclerophora amabilis]